MKHILMLLVTFLISHNCFGQDLDFSVAALTNMSKQPKEWFAALEKKQETLRKELLESLRQGFESRLKQEAFSDEERFKSRLATIIFWRFIFNGLGDQLYDACYRSVDSVYSSARVNSRYSQAQMTCIQEKEKGHLGRACQALNSIQDLASDADILRETFYSERHCEINNGSLVHIKNDVLINTCAAMKKWHSFNGLHFTETYDDDKGIFCYWVCELSFLAFMLKNTDFLPAYFEKIFKFLWIELNFSKEQAQAHLERILQADYWQENCHPYLDMVHELLCPNDAGIKVKSAQSHLGAFLEP